MDTGIKTVIVPVRDLAAAKQVYGTLLGTEPTTDQPFYVGYEVGDNQLGLDPNGHKQGMTGPLAYFHVKDLAATLEQLLAAGATEVAAVRDVGGGRLIASVRDTDGNVVGLLQP